MFQRADKARYFIERLFGHRWRGKMLTTPKLSSVWNCEIAALKWMQAPSTSAIASIVEDLGTTSYGTALALQIIHTTSHSKYGLTCFTEGPHCSGLLASQRKWPSQTIIQLMGAWTHETGGYSYIIYLCEQVWSLCKFTGLYFHLVFCPLHLLFKMETIVSGVIVPMRMKSGLSPQLKIFKQHQWYSSLRFFVPGSCMCVALTTSTTINTALQV